MIRAGEGGRFADAFKEQNCVAIGWNEIGNLNLCKTFDDFRDGYIKHWGNAKPGRTANAVGVIRKFRDEIQAGHMVITYSPELRVYHIGEDLGEYQHLTGEHLVGEYANIRKAKWLGEVSRDALTQGTRNSLGSTLTMFSPVRCGHSRTARGTSWGENLTARRRRTGRHTGSVKRPDHRSKPRAD